MPTNRFRSILALAAVSALLAANIGLPLLFGDVYPFTSAPMFRDSPKRFCSYRVYSPDGQELPDADWQVQRIYDGNPVGYGVGVRPPAILETEFGVIHDEIVWRRHVERQFSKKTNREYEFVEVAKVVVGPVDIEEVGVIRTELWHVYRPE